MIDKKLIDTKIDDFISRLTIEGSSFGSVAPYAQREIRQYIKKLLAEILAEVRPEEGLCITWAEFDLKVKEVLGNE